MKSCSNLGLSRMIPNEINNRFSNESRPKNHNAATTRKEPNWERKKRDNSSLLILFPTRTGRHKEILRQMFPIGSLLLTLTSMINSYSLEERCLPTYASANSRRKSVIYSKLGVNFPPTQMQASAISWGSEAICSSQGREASLRAYCENRKVCVRKEENI